MNIKNILLVIVAILISPKQFIKHRIHNYYREKLIKKLAKEAEAKGVEPPCID